MSDLALMAGFDLRQGGAVLNRPDFSTDWPERITMHINRRSALVFLALMPSLANARQADDPLATVLDNASRLRPLKTVLVSVDGKSVAERGYRGHRTTASANIKSASKSVVSALVGIAIGKGILESADQKIAPLLRHDLPANADPRIEDISIGNLLSMQAGLRGMSGAQYGPWVSSRNWVRTALAAPFEDRPGGAMLYSTASTHLLSAILTQESGRSTRELAREWLGAQKDFAIASWERDPQGIYMGGNQMAMSPRSLLAFGELYRNGGKTADGQQIIPADWIAQSWLPRTTTHLTGDSYGYGWFGRTIGGELVHYGWGYGGQMIYVVPSRRLVVAMTSQDLRKAERNGHRDNLHALLADIIACIDGGPIAKARPGEHAINGMADQG